MSKVDILAGAFFQNAGLSTEEIVSKALDGDADAHLFLCRQAGGALAQSQPMPPALAAYASKVLLDEFYKAKRGRGRPSEWMQNYAIVHALDLLRINGIPPTRNEATDDDLACGSRIVAEIFTDAGIEISESGVEKVWERHRDQFFAFSTAVLKQK